MRQLFNILTVATTIAILLSLFAHFVFPIGPVDGLYGQIRPQLIEAAGIQESRRLMPQLSNAMVDGIQAAVVFTAVPLVATNFGWIYLAFRLLRRSGEI